MLNKCTIDQHSREFSPAPCNCNRSKATQMLIGTSTHCDLFGCYS